MTQQVDFYVLEDLEESVFLGLACRITAKAFKQGMQVYLQTENARQAEKLDQLLWAHQPAAFLPHMVNTEVCKPDTRTRVMLGETAPPAGWNELLISLTTTVPERAPEFARVADLIGGDENQKQFGRQRYRVYKDSGIEPTIHKL